MDNEETVHAAAARETQEEATAEVANMSLYTIYNLPHISQVYVMFRAELIDGKASPGIESLEVALMDESEIPWDDLAFPVIRESLQHYFKDKRQGEFTLHYGDIRRLENRQLEITHY
jgi:ADP-ribose pyrophosphatase YjhB (NUDIX family)